MKTGTIKYSREIKNIAGNVWLGIENEYDMNSEDPKAVFKKAEEAVNEFAIQSGLILQFNNDSIPQATPIAEIQVEKKSEDIRIGVIVQDIMSCNDLIVLDSYKLMVMQPGKDILKGAYEERRRQIIEMETKDIFDRTNKLTKNK